MPLNQWLNVLGALDSKVKIPHLMYHLDVSVKPKQAKIGLNCHLLATSQGSAGEVRTPRAPEVVAKEGHPTIVTFTHKQRVFHLLSRAVIIWKCPSTAHTDG